MSLWPETIQINLLASAGILGSHVRNPSNGHIKGLNHVNRYIKGTPNLGISFNGQAELDLFGCSDAAFNRLHDSSQDLLIVSF
jgi:hypothetical protein